MFFYKQAINGPAGTITLTLWSSGRQIKQMEHINKNDLSINVSSSHWLRMGNIWGLLLTLPLDSRQGSFHYCLWRVRVRGRGWGMIGMHHRVSSYRRLWPRLWPAGSAVTSTLSWDQFKGYPADTCPPSAGALPNGCAANRAADRGESPRLPERCQFNAPAGSQPHKDRLGPSESSRKKSLVALQSL